MPELPARVGTLDDAAKAPDTGAEDAGVQDANSCIRDADSRIAQQGPPGACDLNSHRYDRSQRCIKRPPISGRDVMNVTQGLRRVQQTNPEGIATVDGDRRRSWREIGERGPRLAGGLA